MKQFLQFNFSSERVITKQHFGRSEMNYCFVPSLQIMAATKIVTLIWNRASVISLIAKYDGGWRWRRIEAIVNHNVSLLPPLPAPAREQISSIVVPIGDQIRTWKMTHIRKFGFKNIPREFCWMPRGTIDKKKTAEVFVSDLTLPKGERYGMACLYCLEVSWDNPVPFLGTGYPEFQAYWTYNTTGDATTLDSILIRDVSKTPYQCAFQCAVQCSNEVAAEYYFRKLSPGERGESLFDVELPYGLKDFNFYRFLLLHMNDRQRSKVLEAHGDYVLESLLTWPWQHFFMGMALRVRDTLESDQYSRLLEEIIDKIERRYMDFGYRKLFGEFWVQIPVDHRKDLVRDRRLFWKCFQVMGKENASLMFKDASPEEKEQLVLSQYGVRTCASLADNEDWDSLRFFIGQSITSLHKMIHFKEECEKRCIYANSSFFRFFDELIERCRENSGKDEADCPVPNILCSSSHVSTDQVE